MKTAIYPGSFDPVTLGHLNIIKRAAACFDRLIVCVMINSKKQGMFTPEERVELLKKATARFPNVEVDYSEGCWPPMPSAAGPMWWSRACGACPTLSRRSRWRSSTAS